MQTGTSFTETYYGTEQDGTTRRQYTHGQSPKKEGGSKMKYPKPIMKTSELAAMGFPEDVLREIAKEPGQTIAFRMKPGGNILWDTEKLQRRNEKMAVR